MRGGKVMFGTTRARRFLVVIAISVAFAATAIAPASAAPAWKVQTTQNPDVDVDQLFGVSCASASLCTSVGWNGRTSIAERWNGSTWAVEPTGTDRASLNGVSCPTLASCIAVGHVYVGDNGPVAAAAMWDGSSWTSAPVPVPAGSQQSRLTAVSCATELACTAVGGSESGALVERWDGTQWTFQTLATPVGATGIALNAIDCVSATQCVAAGFWSKSGRQRPLIEHWNGDAWTIQSSPGPVGAKQALFTSVSCSAANACSAVGLWMQNPGVPLALAERWNGTAWAVQDGLNPSNAATSDLYGVSCPTASTCTAVGHYADSAKHQFVLAERWNGSKWVVQAAPKPAGAGFVRLWGVSCSAASVCTAVGSFTQRDADSTLHTRSFAERYS
jgi:hypothetical protein